MFDVQYMRVAVKSFTSYQPTTYCFRADCRHHWLQKAALWVLRKLRCFAPITSEEWYREAVVDLGDLSKQILAQYTDMLNRYGYDGVDCLLCGPSDFHALHQLPPTHPFSMSVSYLWAHRGPIDEALASRYTKEQLRVHVIPNMKGVLLLPKGWNG